MVKKITSLFLILFVVASGSLLAQVNNEFQHAMVLMQEQRYAEALPILQELHENEPAAFAYTDKLLDCLIQLKQYDEGLEVISESENRTNNSSQLQIRKGELHHYKGNKEQAFEIWKSNLDAHSNQLQLYVNTAQTMLNRREYAQAVEVYKAARVAFSNSRLFYGDIANAYLQAGEYEQAIQEWLRLLQDSPGQVSFIQRSLLRYDDPILYDIIIVELDERLSKMSVSSDEFQTLYQLQIWLLQENNLFRRALATAKNYEKRSSTFNYSLFHLGRQLSDNNQFELAEEAFTYYMENSYGEVKWRNMEELSNNYSSWAKYIDDHNLDFSNNRDSLYQLSFSVLDSIITETNNYSRLSNVYIKKAELTLDLLFDLEEAEKAYEQLIKQRDMQDSPETDYLKGRIHLAKKEFPNARIHFTKANKEAGTSELSEKTRYFLALTDFYAGDFEFATIQLKSLGRKNTSYYANDALELRLWLQEGLATDTTGAELNRFAEAVFKSKNGDTEAGSEIFLSFINQPQQSSLKDDALLFFVESDYKEDAEKLAVLSSFLAQNANTPLKEKLMWEQAKVAEKTELRINADNCDSVENCLSENTASAKSFSARDVYEEIILQFPQGFYAPYARERLTDINRENS